MATEFEEIKATFEEFAQAWNRNDGAGLGAFFADEGTLINPFGDRADGREAVSAMYSEYFGGMLAGTSTEITLTNVRALDGGLAFADGDQTIRAPDGTAILAVHLAALLRREGERWRYVDARPYTYASPPT